MKFIVENIQTKIVTSGRDTIKFDVIYEIREYLKIKIEGSFFMMKKAKAAGKFVGDGWHRFVTPKGKFATGFLPTILKFVENELQLPIEIEDRRVNLPLFKKGELNLITVAGEGAEHQERMVKSVDNYLHYYDKQIYFPRGLWDCSTNSRKTATAAILMNNVVEPKAIMLMHNENLLWQNYEFYEEQFGKGNVGVITSKEYRPGKVMTLAMIKTLYNLIENDLNVERHLNNYYNVMYAEECHKLAGKEACKVISKINAGMRVFMSGTPLLMGSKITKFKVIGNAGLTLIRITKQEMISKDISMKPIVNIYLNTEYQPAIDYDEEMNNIIMLSPKRAKLIADIIKDREAKQIVITFWEKKHGEFMLETLLRLYPEFSTRATIVEGTDKMRSDKIAAFKNKQIQILFASTIFENGINAKHIQVVVYGQAGKNLASVNQTCGRGERMDGVHTEFEMIDIYDKGKYVSAHSRKRIAWYLNEGFDVTFRYEADKFGKPKNKK